MPPVRITCPECDEELSSLRYRCETTGWEDGEMELNGRDTSYCDHHAEDSGTNDTNDYAYECPECGHEFSVREIDEFLARQVIAVYGTRRENYSVYISRPPTETMGGVRIPRTSGTVVAGVIETELPITELECPECHKSTVIQVSDSSPQCSNCGALLTINN